ncbi:NAD(P)H-dependent oxidoreductase subunit E [Chloroflexota bacterium]
MSKKKIAQMEWPPELLIRLKESQTESGYLSEEAIAELAGSFGLPVNDVYGAATFYSFFSTKSLGRNVIRICKSLPCHLKDYEMLVAAVGKEIGIKPGETTPDGRFSFELTNCIGLCDGAPAMLINDDPHINLTPEKIARILQEYK